MGQTAQRRARGNNTCPHIDALYRYVSLATAHRLVGFISR
jgi:hypothetical protein